jgi:DNA-binding transcriptional MerR regulator
MTTYSISDLARELDITTRAIRFYEEQGLLSPERHGQDRIYSDKDRVALKLILRGKRIGFSLAECKALIELYDPASGNQKQLQTMLEKLSEQRAKLEQQMLDIRQMRLELETAEERCRIALTQSMGRQKVKTKISKSGAKFAAKRAPRATSPSRSNK